ncbi:MAG: hypothetical protein AAGA65_27375 [Actinomycetota bacterium]
MPDPIGPVELPQLIGLDEHTAIRWALDSGFEVVQDADGPLGPEVLAITERVTLTTDDDGIVTKAIAG